MISSALSLPMSLEKPSPITHGDGCVTHVQDEASEDNHPGTIPPIWGIKHGPLDLGWCFQLHVTDLHSFDRLQSETGCSKYKAVSWNCKAHF